jgi:hypothetical protein
LASRLRAPKMSAFGSLPRKNLVIAVRICILSLTGALALSAAPAVAAAKPGCGAGPTVPADSEIDQYAESIPGACGNQQNDPDGGGSGGGGSGGGGDGSGDAGSAASGAIPPSTVQRLQDLGANGAETQALAEANAPRIRGDGGGRGAAVIDRQRPHPLLGSEGTRGSDPGAGSVLDSLLGSDADDGMGLVLPLILLGITAAGIVFFTRRRMSQAG